MTYKRSKTFDRTEPLGNDRLLLYTREDKEPYVLALARVDDAKLKTLRPSDQVTIELETDEIRIREIRIGIGFLLYPI